MRSPLTLTEIARLIGSPARLRMLQGLTDRGRLTAGELAALGDVSPQAASDHLAKMRTAGLITIDLGHHGARHRAYRLADDQVARAVEAIFALAAVEPTHDLPQRRSKGVVCYSHLGGSLGHALLGALLERGVLEPLPYLMGMTDDYRVTAHGEKLLAEIGLDLSDVLHKRAFGARRCRNVAETDAHLAGAVGHALTHSFFGRGWLVRGEGRSCALTPAGQTALAERFGLTLGQSGAGL